MTVTRDLAVMTEAENIKRQERESYDSIASAYDARLARYNAHFASYMIDLLYPQKNEKGLDVAGGTGTAGLKLAERVSPGGSVSIIDISPEMLKLAAEKASASRLTNVSTYVMDAERIEFPESEFDIVTCSFGVMSFPNVAGAVAEMRRVLKPGGRIGFAVWSVPERFPLYSEPMTAFLRYMAPLPIRALLRMPVIRWRALRRLLVSSTSLGYSPSRFCEAGSLERYLHEAGLQSVRRQYYSFPLEFTSFDDYWNTLMEANPRRETMREIPKAVTSSIQAELRRRLVNPRTNGVRLFNEAAIVLARKPA